MGIFDFKFKGKLHEKIGELEREIDLLKVKLEKTESDNNLLKKQLDGNSINIDSLHELENTRNKMETYYSKMKFLELVVDRYREFIEENEVPSIPELKSKLIPEHPFIQDKIDSFDVDYEKEPYGALIKSKKFIDSINSVKDPGIEFWMIPEQVETLNITDLTYKAVLLCSFALALEFDSRILMSQMTDGTQRSFVSVKTETEHLLLDPNIRHPLSQFSGSRVEDSISSYELKGTKISKVLYEFNEIDYISHEE